MPRYTSITGKDVVLKFKGTQITIPANGYYETSGEDLETIFPKHIKKIELNEIIRVIERRLLPLNIKEIPNPKLMPINLILNSPKEITLAPIKEIILTNEIHKKITETINNSMETTSDPDLKEFLGMIRDILSSDINE